MTAPLDKAGKIVFVQKLLIACPLGSPLDNCPATALRELPLTNRLNLANGMSEDQIDSIITCHKKCLAEREGR